MENVTKEEIKAFINLIAPLAQNEYKKGKYILPSICIAQACCESGYGTSGKMRKGNAVFGIKVGKNKVHFGQAWDDKAYDTKTKECYDGKTFVSVNDFFRAYDSIADSVTDYYDMMISCSRYKGAVGEKDYVKAITAIKAAGYATDPNYINTVSSIIRTNNLTKYDNCSAVVNTPKEQPGKKSISEIVKEVINGKWGSGEDRKKKLSDAGYDYQEIQNGVNATLSNPIVTKIHKVGLGDTLSVIASKYGTTVDKIIKDNVSKYPKIKPNFIVMGWQLKV